MLDVLRNVTKSLKRGLTVSKQKSIKQKPLKIYMLMALSLTLFSCDPPQPVPKAEIALLGNESVSVDTLKIKKEKVSVSITSEGIVKPHRKLSILAEVKGRIIEQSPNLDPGGILSEGEILLKLDPRDYVVDVEKNRANVEKAEFELILEKGKKLVAEKEWQLLDPSLKQGGLGKDLALRIPHLREKEAALHAAQSSLEKSLVDLKRTLIRAPFNSLVLEEFVEKGQVILPQTKVAEVVSTDQFRIQVSVPYDQLYSIFPKMKNSKEKVPVKVIEDLGSNKKLERDGYILRLLGGVDPNGRLVQVLVVVEDPLNLENHQTNQFPLLLGAKVKVQFGSTEVTNAIKLPKSAIHEDDRIWLKNKENKLDIKKVQIIKEDKDYVFIDGKEFEEGQQVIISDIPVSSLGMELRSRE